MRTFDAQLIKPAIDFLSNKTTDIESWIKDETNIVLVNELGDLAIFEKPKDAPYQGHYYFKSRGRQAINSGKEFLDEIFNPCYNIKVVIGLVPLKHLGARWLSRQIGFKSDGIIRLFDEPFELFILINNKLGLTERSTEGLFE